MPRDLLCRAWSVQSPCSCPGLYVPCRRQCTSHSTTWPWGRTSPSTLTPPDSTTPQYDNTNTTAITGGGVSDDWQVQDCGTLCLDCCLTLATSLLALHILWRHSFSKSTSAYSTLGALAIMCYTNLTFYSLTQQVLAHCGRPVEYSVIYVFVSSSLLFIHLPMQPNDFKLV